MKESKRKYKAKVEELRVELYPTDGDIKDRIAERLAKGEAKATYIKRLIRMDIERKVLMKKTASDFGLPFDEQAEDIIFPK